MSKVRENIELSKRRLALYHENIDENKFSLRTLDLLNEIEKALLVRNSIVHGVWSEGDLVKWSPWKPTSKHDRTTHEWIEYRAVSRGDFIGLIVKLIELVQQSEKAISEAESFPR